MNKSYFEIAKDDLLWAEYGMKAEGLPNYNNVVISLQQATEKYLKGFINEYLNPNGIYDGDLKKHNLKKLSKIINEDFGSEVINLRDAKYIGDYYFEARYPGDDYEDITDFKTVETCYEITNTILKTIDRLILKNDNIKDASLIKTNSFGKGVNNIKK